MPHEPTDACRDDHCAYHNDDEPATKETYRICAECFHAFQTAEDLQNAYVDQMVAIDPAVSRALPHPNRILFCPLCTHDW